MNFVYNKLLGRLAERRLTQQEFAKSIGISRGSLSAKLANKTEFTQQEILNAITVLEIKPIEICDYFFNKNV